MIKICAISDTHNKHNKLTIPEVDILIHAGDWTFQGLNSEVENFAKWLDEQPAKHIIVIPGNHEKIFEKVYPSSRNWIIDNCPRANLLIHDSIEIEGIKIFGSAWTPYFFDWAYNAARNQNEKDLYHKPLIKNLWDKIPDDTELLITHGPPYEILDEVPFSAYNANVGCYHLTDRIKELKDLKVHIFGHIHHSYGHKEVNGVNYYNASNCTEQYQATNPVTVFEYE